MPPDCRLELDTSSPSLVHHHHQPDGEDDGGDDEDGYEPGMGGEAFFSTGRGGAGKESKFVERGGPGRGTPPLPAGRVPRGMGGPSLVDVEVLRSKKSNLPNGPKGSRWVQRGPKWSKALRMTIWVPFGPFWTTLER